MIFPAKVDLWFLALCYGLGVSLIVVAPWVRKKPRGGAGGLLLLASGVLFVGVGWRASSVRYVLTHDGYLDATGWPLDGRITHVSAIARIEPSRDPRASHAASLDRLRIDYGRGGLILIAVRDKRAFLEAVAALDPALVQTGTGLRRSAGGDPD